MFRSWSKQALQLIVVILLVIQISVNSVLAQEVASPNAAKSISPNLENTNRVEMPINSSSTEENIRVAPSNERQQNATVSSSRADSSRPKDPYEQYYDAIKSFNEELYGEQG